MKVVKYVNVFFEPILNQTYQANWEKMNPAMDGVGSYGKRQYQC